LHLFGAAFEQASATHTEQGIAAKQAAVAMKGDVARGMPWDFEHAELQAEFRQADGFPLAEHPALAGDTAVMWPEYFCTTRFLQAPHAANMVSMMVSDQDVIQPEAPVFQNIQYRLRIARIDNGTGSSTCGDQPDIIV
jgi:hypothetical protein